ncbi:hypothetical protein CVT26_012753 [Gymnopilus dilepis]|uniref:Reverse transcriptase zinc-binding domain-containing protein n=1 Tax=Gymnopilus dilepis TaxID=231916 RepID=A0A409WY04_9AGAR|nr:hypothetical protein CVT26_012753 [Gymnopilus dilepis]
MTSVRAAMRAQTQKELDDNTKLYLLRNRLEPKKDGEGFTQVTFLLRHYLKVANAAHRQSLTRLILSCHPLALERLRHTEHRRPKIPRDMRLCRFCKVHIESPEHALLECAGNEDIMALRTEFTNKLEYELPQWDLVKNLDPVNRLRTLIAERDTIGLLAKFTHEVIALYEATPVLIPSLPLDWVIARYERSTSGNMIVS